MSDDQMVWPHILCKDLDAEREQVAVATVDGTAALVVSVSEERARELIGATSFEGMEARPATLEEIEAVCAHYGLGAVGLFGLGDEEGLDVLSVEVLGMVLEGRARVLRVHGARRPRGDP
jgi:hypothetical protein